MLLSELLAAIPVITLDGPDQRPVGRVTDRDADVGAGDVFVALKGAHVDGHSRIAGLGHAAAIVVERPVSAPPGPTVVQVADTRRALPHLCAAAWGHPGRDMAVVGVTGTNGKTSTTFLISAMARAAGWKTGIIGTTGHFIDDQKMDATHTTPTAPVVQGLLARMRDAGCKVVAMEVSSIGLATFRADAIPFKAAIFTNLTRDHLDFHGTMAAYAEAKRRLFHELLSGVAVLNADDPATAQMQPHDRTCWRFSRARPAELAVTDVVATATGTSARFITPMGSFSANLRLVGRHNLENALGALGGALAAGVPLDACQRGLEALDCVPGRLEAVPNSRGLAVLVDYAHTDDALQRVLTELRRLGPARILTVFGCGGDRDRGKRPLMGRAAAEGSDVVFVTSDNPRSEDPRAIIDDILPGVGDRPHVIEPDRRAAIFAAIAAARPGDIVLIAGKGHEATQQIGSTYHTFDDRAVAREALATG